VTHPPPPEAVSSELVTLAQGGDSRALRTLVERAHPLVRRWALVHTGDATDADDLTQDVLVHMIRRLNRYEGRSAFTTWLYAVTRNAAKDHLRARARRDRLGERFEAAGGGRGAAEASEHRDPAAEARRSGLAAAALEAFRKLPTRQREAFDLAELQGLAAVEAGARLGIAASTVRVNLLRARRALRARLLEMDPTAAEGRT
jgi:RNA polymerase sigma-70 factor, ECF subfamily